MIIGIDIDSTITSTGKKAREYLEKFEPGIKDTKYLSKKRYHEFLDLYEEEIHETCELKKGVKEAFLYFKENNYKIIFITARNNNHCKNQEQITINYLKNHGLEYETIIFNKHKKGHTAKKYKCELFIDDKESVLDNVNKYHIECLKFGKGESKYLSFDNWYDIIEYIKAK